MTELGDIALRAYQDYARYLWNELSHLHTRNWILWLVGLSGLVYLLELLLPWRRQQRALRSGFWLDLFYMFFNFFLFALLLQRAGAEILVHLFRSLLANLGVENLVAIEMGALPPWIQILVLFVLRDFLHWNVHRVLHRVPWLWEFHKVHHSVEEMGFAAHLRFHPMESVVYRSVEYLFFAFLGFGIDDFFIAHLAALWIGHLNHSNLRLPLGMFRYLLNNPQMHIWHHAKEFPSQHRHGMNFGLSLSCWDYLFKTAYVPHSGRDLTLGFAGISEYPQNFAGQMAKAFRPSSWKASLAILLLLQMSGCEELPGESVSPGPDGIRAMSLVSWEKEGYADAQVALELDRVAATGATHVVFLVTAYQEHATSARLRVNDPRTPSPSSLRSAMLLARTRGLQLGLKAHVDPDDGSWRGRIRVAEPREWFDSYEQFLLPLADLAQEQAVEFFFVGTELAGMLDSEDLWRSLIARCRTHFDGTLVYAASWDEADDVPFWDALDLVGVNFYFPLALGDDPTRLDLLAQWQPWLWRLQRLHTQAGRDIFLSEIGYRSVDGAARAPYDFASDATFDGGEQEDLYWAALEATSGRPWIAGLNWWNWLASGGGGRGDLDFTPRAKPAEALLRKAWSN